VPPGEALRFSVLKEMGRSPAHVKYAMEHERPDTAPMRLGRLAHALALGTPVGPIWTGARRGKEWLSFKAEHEGKDIVTDEEYGTAQAMAASLEAHSEARKLLCGVREHTVLFYYAGRACRTTPDVYTAEALTELKSTYDANPTRFPYHAMRMGYHAQVAFQKDGLVSSGTITKEQAEALQLVIVAVEVKPPYAVAVFYLTPRAEELGRRLYRSWMEQFLVCEASDAWPGYGHGVIDAPEDALELVGADGEALEIDEDETPQAETNGFEVAAL